MKRLLTVVALAVVLQACSGCAIVGAVAAKTIGEPPDPAKYTPPQQPMLVVVENYQHAADLEGPADQIAESLTRQLAEHKVAPVVEQSALLELRASHRK